MKAISCGAARRQAWGRGDPVVMPVARVRALAHFTQCADCRRFASDMERFRTAVSAAGPAPAAPETLRLRVRAATAREGRVRRFKYRLLRPVTVLAAAALLVVWAASSRHAEGFDRLVVNRQQELLALPGIESSDAAAVQAWLGARSPFHVHVPTFPDARLTGATLTTVGGGTTTVIRFQVGNQVMLYAARPNPQSVPDDSTLRQIGDGHPAVATWRAGGIEHLWVGTVSPKHLASFAARCAEQAAAALRPS